MSPTPQIWSALLTQHQIDAENHGTMCLYRGTMGLHHSFTCPYQGQAFLCVKKWFEAQISGILPNVFSYISHFVCLYNFNYTGRPLRGPGIIRVILHKHQVQFNAMTRNLQKRGWVWEKPPESNAETATSKVL